MARRTTPPPEPEGEVVETDVAPGEAVNAETGDVTPAGDALPPVDEDAYPDDAVELDDVDEDQADAVDVPEDVTGRPIFPAGWDR